MENWIAEKLQLATEESYKDPANIQSKHQKHQAFEAELAANADRIQSVLAMGQNLIDKHQCAGSEEAVQVGQPAVYNVFSYVEHACLLFFTKMQKSLDNFKFNVVMNVLSSY
jgi:spectrin alpha